MTAEQTPVPRRRGPSMADVARLAGVSGQTVSRVANGRHNVDADTRERVLAAMREVGYRPNSAARALRNGRFRSIGVIVFELSSFGNTRTLDAIAAAATTRGYAVNLLPVLDASQEAVSGAFSRLGEQAVDGVIILIEAHTLDDAEVPLPDGLPVVVVDSSAHYDYPIVDTDQAQGARLATEHLLDLGHQTVWHLGGPPSSFAAARRLRSWQQTLTDRGRVVPPVLVGDWSAGSGYEAGRQLADNPDVSAVFVANDQMALGLLRALHERGRAVPEDVSVVGFDDQEEAAQFWPPLTTIRQSFAEVGRRSVDALINEIQAGEHHHQPVSVATELVVRSSTAPPR
ncbi:DNA-binding LacI/PurR family transcriptional regulator [Kribbella orskensis]|uniref:DNA-binding LacI/PurR family transcriptional regulator n=1 Tax=Kribbella orskensis TaxID=2512216 RepID=A0ABY2BFJ3_9ACTN|nr:MULTISPECIES: LacI family DNA-binding transcriptional regulator [Kribbella]TCN35550.1 DNA-binding LacI/PurR family transcriptional regulator [Kribbella sp. VKM Ac-2500]TCO17092.1 DNA-binding LacI/PurR family transcriptional regulator [Kribbella orskensis]